MRVSPMVEDFRGQALPLTEYRGSLTATQFAVEPRLRPWPEGQAILFDGSWRASLEVAGLDARKWLNGMISANVRDLAPGEWKPSFQLDPKGHILGTLDVVCTGPDRFLLLTDQDQVMELEGRLRKFVFISKLTIENRSESHSSLILRGAVEVPAAGEEVRLSSTVGGIPQLEMHATGEAARGLWSQLQARAQPAGSESWERDRVLGGVPRFGCDLGEGELPQETGQLDRLDFTKGCYVGQEIVERIRARGAVHRHFVGIRFSAPVAPGAPLTVAGNAVGRVTSAVPMDATGAWLGLGYLRSPHDAAATLVEAGAVTGTVETLA